MEPDGYVFPLDQPSPWMGVERLTREVPRIRSALEGATGASAGFCWGLRMDPQIALAYGSPAYALERFGAFFDEAMAAGDAVGVHPHAWRWEAERQVWLADHANQAWVDECVAVAAETYASVLGARPTYHRFGSGFMSTRTMNVVRELGIPVDLTVEPGQPARGPRTGDGIVWTGSCWGFEDVPRHPYQPDPADFRRAAAGAGDGFWAIPLTSSRKKVGPSATPLFRARYWAHRPSAAARRVARTLTRTAPPFRPLRMWPGGPAPATFWDVAFDAASESPDACLAFSLRSDVFLDRETSAWFEAIVGQLAAEPRRERVRFVTPQQALAMTGRAAGSADRPA